MYSVYILKHPNSDIIVYVGLTTNPSKRLYEHRRRFGISCIDKKVSCYDLVYPDMEVIQETKSKPYALKLERKWTAHYFKLGCPLRNINNKKTPA